jgi:hypothetical protein
MSETRANTAREMLRLRLSILLTALSIALAITLLIKGSPYLFTLFMFVGPALLAAAAVLLLWNILDELRAKKVL